MISFTHSRIYKDIGSKAFFTMATLLMPLLENVKINFQAYQFPIKLMKYASATYVKYGLIFDIKLHQDRMASHYKIDSH